MTSLDSILYVSNAKPGELTEMGRQVVEAADGLQCDGDAAELEEFYVEVSLNKYAASVSADGLLLWSSEVDDELHPGGLPTPESLKESYHKRVRELVKRAEAL